MIISYYHPALTHTYKFIYICTYKHMHLLIITSSLCTVRTCNWCVQACMIKHIGHANWPIISLSPKPSCCLNGGLAAGKR